METLIDQIKIIEEIAKRPSYHSYHNHNEGKTKDDIRFTIEYREGQIEMAKTAMFVIIEMDKRIKTLCEASKGISIIENLTKLMLIADQSARVEEVIIARTAREKGMCLILELKNLFNHTIAKINSLEKQEATINGFKKYRSRSKKDFIIEADCSGERIIVRQEINFLTGKKIVEEPALYLSIEDFLTDWEEIDIDIPKVYCADKYGNRWTEPQKL